MHMDFSVGMGRNLRFGDVADHVRVQKNPGFPM